MRPLTSTALEYEFVMYEGGSTVPERFYQVEKLIIAFKAVSKKASESNTEPPKVVIHQPITIRNPATLYNLMLEMGFNSTQLKGLA
jgi:hypothetical protein